MKTEQTAFCTCAGLVSPVDLTCKTCGRLSVGGMGHPATSIVDTSNLELTNFIDHELTWKTVKKGFRSSSTRSRKPARIFNMGVQEDDKSTRKGESSVSESEKLGVAILGRRFAEKIEHVPIKKRRPLLQSPSILPGTPSPHREDSLSSQPSSSPQPEDFDQTAENKCDSSPWWCSELVSNRELVTSSGFPFAVQLSSKNDMNRYRSRVSDGKLGYTEDFSGIALLAAAACNSSIGDDAHNVKEGQSVDDLLISERSVDEAFPESGNLLLRESAHEDSVDDPVIEDDSVVALQNSLDKGESEARKRSSSKRDVRLHWDLNTVMEAWELPCEDLSTGSQRNVSEDAPDNSVHSENPDKLEGCANYGEPVAPELLQYFAAKTEVSTQVISKDKSLYTSLSYGSESISNRPLSEEKINTSPTSVIEQSREGCSGTSVVQLGQKVPTENDVFLLNTEILGKVVCESDGMQSEEAFTKTLDIPDNRTSLTELISSATGQITDVEYCVSKSGKSGLSNAPSVRDDLSRLDPTFREGQPFVAVNVEEKQYKEAPTADAILMDSSLNFEMKELMPKSYGFGKVELADPIDDGKGLVSHSRHCPIVCVEKMTRVEGGYESPFEDGELRESVVYSCEENEDGETECLDYDSDYRDGDAFSAANQCLSEVGSDSHINGDNGGFPEKDLPCGRASSLKESSHSSALIKCSGQNHLPQGFECYVDGISEANNIHTGFFFADESIDGLHVVGSSAGEVGSRASRGIFSSNVQQASCSDSLDRKSNVYMQRGRRATGFQAGRIFGSGKYLERDRSVQRRNKGDSRNYYETGNTQVTRYPRRSSFANSGAKMGGLTFRGESQYSNCSSKDEYQPLIRRRSPADSDDGYCASRRMVAARENLDHSRSRGRGRIYTQGFSRVPREEYEYEGPMSSNNPASSSVRSPHYFRRGEHSFSPIRGASFSGPHRSSRPRSRSRSPLTFRSQRGRNTGVRRLSRSPEFRSDARMGRGRMPFKKSNFAADDGDGIISPPRTRFSPQRHPRWINNDNYGSNNFVDRNPPGRLLVGSQKFDSGGSHGRMRSDEFLRHVIRPGKFTEHSDGGNREPRYSGGKWERMKCPDKYESVEKNHGLRRCNTRGVIRRFRIDEKGCSMLRNTRNEDICIKGGDRRDMPRSAREGRSPFRYSSERMYVSGPKLSGICDSNVDVSPSRG